MSLANAFLGGVSAMQARQRLQGDLAYRKSQMELERKRVSMQDEQYAREQARWESDNFYRDQRAAIEDDRYQREHGRTFDDKGDFQGVPYGAFANDGPGIVTKASRAGNQTPIGPPKGSIRGTFEQAMLLRGQDLAETEAANLHEFRKNSIFAAGRAAARADEAHKVQMNEYERADADRRYAQAFMNRFIGMEAPSFTRMSGTDARYPDSDRVTMDMNYRSANDYLDNVLSPLTEGMDIDGDGERERLTMGALDLIRKNSLMQGALRGTGSWDDLFGNQDYFDEARGQSLRSRMGLLQLMDGQIDPTTLDLTSLLTMAGVRGIPQQQTE